MLQYLGEIVSPFSILCVHLAGALDSTRQVKSLKFTLSAYYAGGFRLAYRHRRGHCEDVLEQPVLDCLPLHHVVLVTIVVPCSMQRFTLHALPSSRSPMRRCDTRFRRYGERSAGNSKTSPTFIDLSWSITDTSFTNVCSMIVCGFD